MIHPNSTYNHIIENWTFASAALMNAAGTYVTADIGKLCYRTDTFTYFRLLSTTPTWEQVTSTSVLNNFSTASQNMSSAARTYLTNSNIAIPPNKLQIGTMFVWGFSMTKTGAGVATSVFDIAVGTAGTTADTARVSFTKPGGSGVIDEAWVEIYCICRGPLSASGVFAGQFVLVHNLSATGHALIPCVVLNTISGTFDVTVASLIVGLCVTPGASDNLTFQLVQANAYNLA